MRWVCERFTKNGMQIVSVVYADDLFMASVEYGLEHGQILSRRDMDVCGLYHGTFTDNKGHAIVIYREKLTPHEAVV